MPPEPPSFRRIGERTRLELGFLSIATGTYVGPDGFTFERDVIRHPGAVCVVALDEASKVVAVRQYRAAVDQIVLEIPAGKMDVPGEEPAVCAARELAEEVGLAARSWTPLGTFFNSPGFTDETTHCFLAERLSGVGTSTQGIEEDHMTIERFALDDLDDLVARGLLVDLKTIAACALAQRVLARRAASGGRTAAKRGG
jgi:ADP-ribose pyrophosphatase